MQHRLTGRIAAAFNCLNVLDSAEFCHSAGDQFTLIESPFPLTNRMQGNGNDVVTLLKNGILGDVFGHAIGQPLRASGMLAVFEIVDHGLEGFFKAVNASRQLKIKIQIAAVFTDALIQHAPALGT